MGRDSNSRWIRRFLLTAAVGLALLSAGCGGSGSSASNTSSGQTASSGQLPPSSNSSGQFTTFSTNGSVNFNNEFFKSLGTNGRTCVSCHQPNDGWTIIPSHVQARFSSSNGTDPVFTPNDGSTCPTDDVSTISAKQTAYNLLLNKGLIRIARPVPASADFTLQSVDDPYSCTSASNIAMFRRPLPATNLKFETTIMWDERENVTPQLFDNLKSQAEDATLTHAQSNGPPTDAQLTSIVNFELALFTAQSTDSAAGSLTDSGGKGGAQNLSQQAFTPGANSFFGAGFNPNVFTLYNSWSNLSGSDSVTQARLSIARGQAIFNNRLITIDGVAGLNDVAGQVTIMGSCSTCHATPNVGAFPVDNPMNIGTADTNRRTPDLPLYIFKCNAGGQFQVSDPGFALTTGKCADIAKFKVPGLRDLAARAPFFHDGGAATLLDVVNFYDNRFQIHLTTQEKTDLVNFLNAL